MKHQDIIDYLKRVVEKTCEDKRNIYGYQIWYHILRVVDYGKQLAEKVGADPEIVEIAAYLHDYAAIKNHKHREEHHLLGAEEAEKILKKLNYPQEKIEKVKYCILTHRGSKRIPPKTLEAKCLADADALSHFDAIPHLFYLCFKQKQSPEQSAIWILKKLERDWKKMTPLAKKMIKNKYQAAGLLLKR